MGLMACQRCDRLLLSFSLDKPMIVALLYLVLSGVYLLVVPFGLYIYLDKRWYVASSFERSFMYFLVFFFFPGLLLLSPFLNFRPKKRQAQG
jgi:NAD(P)H-quinone oxidoreductase subunit L